MRSCREGSGRRALKSMKSVATLPFPALATYEKAFLKQEQTLAPVRTFSWISAGAWQAPLAAVLFVPVALPPAAQIPSRGMGPSSRPQAQVKHSLFSAWALDLGRGLVREGAGLLTRAPGAPPGPLAEAPDGPRGPLTEVLGGILPPCC